MSVRQNRVPGAEGESESYPDPRRSWGRSGGLLATWGVLLLIVYFAGWTFDSYIDKTPESNLDKPVEDANQTARRVLQFSFAHREPAKADELLCEQFTGVTPRELTKELTDWEEKEGVLSDATVTFEDVNGQPIGDGTLFPMRVELEVDPSFVTWNYEVTVQNDGDSFCVSKVENVTPSNDLGFRECTDLFA